MRPTLTRDFLWLCYIDQQKSLEDISRETGWAVPTVCVHLRKHGISKRREGCPYPKRKPGTQRLTREFLEKEYVAGNRTTYEIAESVGVSPTTVQRRLKKLGIAIRGNEDYADDLANKTFGYLEVTSETKRKKVRGRHRTYYLCRCRCGLMKWIRRDRLANGTNLSCGCLELANRESFGGRTWTGCGDISGGYWAGIQGRARRAGRKCTVSIAEAWKLFENQGRRCALTGFDLVMPPTARKGLSRSADGIKYASLDRIDSALGYIPGNIQWVWSVVNMMKWTLPQAEFVSICKRISEQQ